MKRLLTEAITFVYNGDVNVELWCLDHWRALDWLGAASWCETTAEILEVEGGGETAVGAAHDENFEGHGLGGEGGCLNDGSHCGRAGVCDRKKREKKVCISRCSNSNVDADGTDVSGRCTMSIFSSLTGNLNV